MSHVRGVLSPAASVLSSPIIQPAVQQHLPPPPIPLPPQPSNEMFAQAEMPSSLGYTGTTATNKTSIYAPHTEDQQQETAAYVPTETPLEQKSSSPRIMEVSGVNPAQDEQQMQPRVAQAQAGYTTQPQQSYIDFSEEPTKTASASSKHIPAVANIVEGDDLKYNKFTEKVMMRLGSKYPTAPRFVICIYYLF